MKVFQLAGTGILMLSLPVLCAAADLNHKLDPQTLQPGAQQMQSATGSLGLGKASQDPLNKGRSLSGETGTSHEDPLQLHFKNAQGGYDTYDLETGTWEPGSSEFDNNSGSLGDPLNPNP